VRIKAILTPPADFSPGTIGSVLSVSRCSLSCVSALLAVGQIEVGVAGGEDVGEVGQFDVEVLGGAAEQVKGFLGRAAAALHENAFGLADYVAGVDRLLQLSLPKFGGGEGVGVG
jgi:hypothetical protein